MKKLFLLAVVLLSAVGIMAQEREGTLTVQPRIGANLSSMTDYNKTSFGYAFGMEMEYQMTDLLSLSAGLMYSGQGAEDDESGIKETLDIDFVNVPIMLNCYVVPGLAVKAGIQPAFRTKTTVKSDGIKMDVDELFQMLGYSDTQMSKFMLSVPVGLSYEYKHWVLDARYNFGVTDLFKGEGTLRNNVFQLTLGYKFKVDF
ncbi:MAG: PorT family protein [Prevotella sp.]|nr:PorT family protein [Prevotella sp.]